MNKVVLLTALAVLLCVTGFSQTGRFWSATTQSRGSITADKSTRRASYPTDIKLFNLAVAPFQQELLSIVGRDRQKPSTVISLPNAAGAFEEFEVYEASNFEPALQEQFPQIRSFSGKGITDKYASVKLSISPQGIQTMVFRTDKENEFIEPYSANHTIYAVYAASRNNGALPWNCSTPEATLTSGINREVGNIAARSTGDLKTLRLAQSVTAEYSNYFGATSASQVSLVLAAINNTLTRCNGVYEKDLALHLNLIANTTAVIYYNPSTDPYDAASTGAGGTWNGQLQNTLTSVIGEANYDIGHLFGASGGGGNAGCIGCVCTNGSKGSGFTSPNDGVPQGDNFDVDYVVHEVGHQLGANHTFSMNNEGTGVNKEPGSGITIMGYAGITAQDLAAHSFDFYQEASIAQIQANIGTKTCPVTTNIAGNNATPVVAAVSNYTIPKSTPFALTGSATDANTGDALTYCWEQNDNASSSQTGTSSVASATKASGPNWISFRPTASPTRYFPQLATILAGGTVTGPLAGGDAGANIEALSSVARTLNFRLTVRDNAVYRSTAPVSVGQTQFTDMVVTVNGTAGPFSVTAPNTAVSYIGGSQQTITWAVAGTTAAPVSCANVKISLSTDGGQTFPVVLSASTPNDGSEVLTIPSTTTTTARIKIESVGNIFFDISNANFSISAGSGCGAPSGLAASAITTTGATVSWSAVSGAVSYDVDYKLSSSSTWTAAASATTATSVNITGLAASSVYDYRVRTNCSSASSTYTAAQFTTAAAPSCGTVTGLSSSAITTSSATVAWSALSGAVSYSVDYKAASSSAWVSAATGTTATSVTLTGLAAGTVYDWRVRANCSGATGAYASAQFTTTAASTCPGVYDVSTNGSASGAATIPLNTDVKGTISANGDNDWYKFVITTGGTATVTLTTLPGDYDVKLFSSNATTQLAISENGNTTSESISRTFTAGTYYLQVYGYNGANSSTNCYTLKVQTGTATRSEISVTKAAVSIYPNPVGAEAKIDMGGYADAALVTVTDMFGRRMLTKTFSGNTTISTNKMAAGVYMITITNKAGVLIKQDKLVKE